MRTWILIGAVLTLTIGGCQSNRPIPEPIASQVDRSVTFDQIKQSPDAYQGRMVALGGQVLSAKRLKEGTRLEVLQLPLDRRQQPVNDRTQSGGRFYALSKEPLDPATLVTGLPITVAGEVTGSQMGNVDEADYRFPTVEVRHLHVWDPSSEPRQYARPGVGVSVGGGYGSWGGGFGGIGIGMGF